MEEWGTKSGDPEEARFTGCPVSESALSGWSADPQPTSLPRSDGAEQGRSDSTNVGNNEAGSGCTCLLQGPQPSCLTQSQGPVLLVWLHICNELSSHSGCRSSQEHGPRTIPRHLKTSQPSRKQAWRCDTWNCMLSRNAQP